MLHNRYLDTYGSVCVCVCTCTYLMYHLCGRSQKCEGTYVFTCLFHRCLIMDGWMLACVCVCVCVCVYVCMSICIACVVGINSANGHMFLHVCFIGA